LAFSPGAPIKSVKLILNYNKDSVENTETVESSNSPRERIAIVGAGISGLTAAWQLAQDSDKQVVIFESAAETGGCVQTRQIDLAQNSRQNQNQNQSNDISSESTALFDTGPNSLLLTSAKIQELIESLGLKDQQCFADKNSNKRFVLRDGKLHQVPTSPTALRKSSLFSTKAKLRLILEPFLPKLRDADDSVAGFVKRRLGKEFLDYAINPFVAGVYAGDPSHLGIGAAFPKLYALEHRYGSIIMGSFLGARARKKRGETSKDRATMFSFKQGLAQLTDTLTQKLQAMPNVEFRLENTVDSLEVISGAESNDDSDLSVAPNPSETTSISKSKQDEKFPPGENPDLQEIPKKYVDAEETFKQILLNVPAGSMAHILREQKPELSKSLTKVLYPPVQVVFSIYKRDQVQHTLDGFGFLIPEVENRRILGTLFSSSLFPGRVPEGYVALTTFVGGMRQPEIAKLSEQEVHSLTHEENSEILGIEGKAVHIESCFWEKAIPQYDQDYREIMDAFAELEKKNPGLHIAGNLRRGISMSDSILSALATAEKM